MKLHEGDIVLPGPSPVELVHLQYLDLNFGAGGVAAPDALFRNLDLLALEACNLFVSIEHHIDRRWSFLKALRNLQRLILMYAFNSGPSGSEEIPSLLESTPSLTRLAIFGARISAQIVQSLTLRPMERQLCPELETINLCSDIYDHGRRTHTGSIDEDSLVDMISSRWRMDVEEPNGAITPSSRCRA